MNIETESTPTPTEPDELYKAMLVLTKRLSESLTTKRELFAGMAMQGMLAADKDIRLGMKEIAEWSVSQADALIAALNKEGK